MESGDFLGSFPSKDAMSVFHEGRYYVSVTDRNTCKAESRSKNKDILEARRQQWPVPQPAGMTSEGASAVLVADVTGNRAASMTPLMALPLPKPTTGPAHQPAWEQPLPPLMVEMIIPTLAVCSAQASEGGWFHSLPPQAPPSAAQLAPIILPGNFGPQSNGSSWEGGLATSQAKASLDDSKTTYYNYQRWQRFKALARRHLPESPDADALSCFLMPALRSLCRLKPTMTLQEGIGQAMQEWHCKNNFDRMFYYDLAAE
ncbi:NUT family member 2G-like [Saccopteryx leptura]|uniref:NUT family member 2G-like n=1 Tax=Saccopteryx leptura TaxID=249018 RepID=UPI00339BC84C